LKFRSRAFAREIAAKMPGLPPAGGWGSSGRTLGIKMEGFTDEDIAKAVDYCDNDKVKTLKYLAKLKEKGGGYNWKPEVEKLLPGMDAQMRGLCQKLLTYDNVPIKQKTFVNFAKNSLALMRQPQLAEKMWDMIGSVLKKPAQDAAAAEADAALPSESDHAAVEEESKPKKKKNKSVEETQPDDNVTEGKKKSKEASNGKQEVDEPDVQADAPTKKKKKSKPAAEEEAPAEEEDIAPAEEEKKKKKKKKSKDCDAEDAEAMADSGPSAGSKRTAESDGADDDGAAERKKKKKEGKKDKDAGGAAGNGGQFDFYEEPEAVGAASPAEVLKFRTETTIKVSPPAGA
jgi:hypothetical protein